MKKKYLLLGVFLIIVTLFLLQLFKKKRSFDQNEFFPIEIFDNGLVFSVTTKQKNVSDILFEKNISFSDKDYIFPAPEAKIFPGSRVIIQRAMPITIQVDGETKKLNTLGKTVQDAISEAGIILSHADKVTPGKNILLFPNIDIIVTRINFEEITVEEDIDFQTIEKEDNSVPWRKKETKQKGEKGIREKTYRITYTNGKETNRQLLGSKITKQPIPQIEVIGTKIIVGKTQIGDATWYENGNEMTCASLDFSFGTYLRVTNRANGRSVIVRVNDSGPYGKGRIIDLNKPAFKKIGDLGTGVIRVKVEEIIN